MPRRYAEKETRVNVTAKRNKADRACRQTLEIRACALGLELIGRIETCEPRVELVELIQIFTAIGCHVENEIGRFVTDLLKIATPDGAESPKVDM